MKALIRPVIDMDDAFGSAMRLNQWMMNEKMWLLASLEALSFNPLNPNPIRTLQYYSQVAEQHYRKKLSDLIGEQVAALMTEGGDND